MQIIKYPIQEVDIETIPGNRMLSIGITQSQKALCEKSIRQYGLLTPIVLMENPSGELMTLTGENELEVLKEMDVQKAEVFVTKLKNRSDSGKVILMLSSFKQGLNPLSEGLILRELLKAGGYTQKELAQTIMKSTSWVSKRLTLAEQLSDNVAELVLSKHLCPASAQDIARLPKAVQHPFAMAVYSKSIPKSAVERLVSSYNNKTTPESMKVEILRNPLEVSQSLIPLKVVKVSSSDPKKDIPTRLDSSLRLLLKLVAEIEMSLTNMEEDEIKKYQRFFPVVDGAVSRFINLIKYHSISLGKPTTLEGGDSYGSN